MDGLTFAAFLTPAGMIAAGLIINRLVEIVKRGLPSFYASVQGVSLALLFSAILYCITAVVIAQQSGGLEADDALQVFSAWLAVAGGAVGLNSAVTHMRA